MAIPEGVQTTPTNFRKPAPELVNTGEYTIGSVTNAPLTKPQTAQMMILRKDIQEEEEALGRGFWEKLDLQIKENPNIQKIIEERRRILDEAMYSLPINMATSSAPHDLVREDYLAKARSFLNPTYIPEGDNSKQVTITPEIILQLHDLEKGSIPELVLRIIRKELLRDSETHQTTIEELVLAGASAGYRKSVTAHTPGLIGGRTSELGVSQPRHLVNNHTGLGTWASKPFCAKGPEFTGDDENSRAIWHSPSLLRANPIPITLTNPREKIVLDLVRAQLERFKEVYVDRMLDEQSLTLQQ